DVRELLAFFARQLTADENKKLAAQLQGMSVRAIRDVCLRAERQLAREQIEQGTASTTPAAPTLAYYVRTLAEYHLGRPVNQA
ncbi:MAG TPA: hypothetical protein PLF85_11810, partial [Turneriella sp.]|nr:hypothetical protein [Turneriella sp.]